jgi:pteridine reductase
VKNSRRAALITGASKRLGRQIALGLARDNIDIAIHYKDSKEEALTLQKEIEILGVKAEIFYADLNKNCYEALIKDVSLKLPHLSILINNAAIFEETAFLKTDEDKFDRHFNINLKAPFFLTQNFAKIQKEGVVVNLLDSKVVKSSKNYFSYLLTKKSLTDFTKMAARELGPNIRVNGVAPGITEFSLDIDDGEYLNNVIKSLPLKKIAKADEIFGAVKVLIDRESLTGQILFIDSGENL